MSDTTEITMHDISAEAWREYEHGGRTFRIESPVTLYLRPGGSTHRVLDAEGVVHCNPAPGDGCALRWKPRDPSQPVQF
jgi:hypothetical protein